MVPADYAERAYGRALDELDGTTALAHRQRFLAVA
jgi:hypothetical protein